MALGRWDGRAIGVYCRLISDWATKVIRDQSGWYVGLYITARTVWIAKSVLTSEQRRLYLGSLTNHGPLYSLTT